MAGLYAKKLSPDAVGDIVHQYREGRAVRVIAAEFDVSPGLVCYYAKAHGIAQRKPAVVEAKKECSHCGGAFVVPKRNNAKKFCSSACRNIGVGESITLAKLKRDAILLKNGYVSVLPEGSRVRRLEHRLIAEAVLGRPLKPGEVVHHINEDKADNRRGNLLICTRSYHALLHHRMRRLQAGLPL